LAGTSPRTPQSELTPLPETSSLVVRETSCLPPQELNSSPRPFGPRALRLSVPYHFWLPSGQVPPLIRVQGHRRSKSPKTAGKWTIAWTVSFELLCFKSTLKSRPNKAGRWSQMSVRTCVRPSVRKASSISVTFGVQVEVDEWCTTVWSMTRSKVKVKVPIPSK